MNVPKAKGLFQVRTNTEAAIVTISLRFC